MSWVIVVFLAISTLVTNLIYTNAQVLSAANEQGEVAAISGNMVVYHSYVVTYAVANPGVTGTVPDASLGLPSWFNRNGGIMNYVSGGRGYVYYLNPPGNLAYQLLKDTDHSIFVGVKQAGTVTNPISGVSTIAAPGAIPDGAVIYAN